MFIQVSKKLKLVVTTLATVGALWISILLTLDSIASYAEKSHNSFPFKQEDWLRYLLPSKFAVVEKEKPRILLTGSSTVRENLRYELFKKKLPEYTILQGGISLGAMEDALAGFLYIKETYGEDKLPQIVVLGTHPRFISNIPEERPFRDGINNYSPYYSINKDNNRIKLIQKGTAKSLLSRVLYYKRKQPKRFRTAMLAILNSWLSGTGFLVQEGKPKRPQQKLADTMFKLPLAKKIIGSTQFKRALNFDFSEVLAWLPSPYKYQLDYPAKTSGLLGWMNEEGSWWSRVHSWQPGKNGPGPEIILNQFAELLLEHNIKLLVVNMPERDISRNKFNPDSYKAYLNFVESTFAKRYSTRPDDFMFVNLQEFLSTDEFHDLQHTAYKGSMRLSNEVIRILKLEFARPVK